MAPPAQLDTDTAGGAVQVSQAASKRATMSASDQRLESSTSSMRACRRPRSRWSNPIANLSKLGGAEAVVISSRAAVRGAAGACDATGQRHRPHAQACQILVV